MEQQKIVFVSHCALNTAAKVQRSAQEGEQEEKLRREFLHWVVDQGIQLIQLPCPEFTLYGASRWGHVKEQFDNPFFRDHCRKILSDNTFINYKDINCRVIFLCTDGRYKACHTAANNEYIRSI